MQLKRQTMCLNCRVKAGANTRELGAGVILLVLLVGCIACSSGERRESYLNVQATVDAAVGATQGAREDSVATIDASVNAPMRSVFTVEPADTFTPPDHVTPLESPAPGVVGCALFPADNVWNTPIDTLPIDSNSDAYIATIGADIYLHPDFGSGTWEGSQIGIPYVVVPGSQPKVPVTFDYYDESDPGPYPIPRDAPIEGGSDSDGDRHILIVDRDNCSLYELFYAFPQSNGSWRAGSGAIFDLHSNVLRQAGWTSADAAGLPILPGLVRFEEVAVGEIRHSLRFTAPQTRQEYVWPARHFASTLPEDQYPPLGQRFRLRDDFDTSGFSPEVQVILLALKEFGMILADNGAPWFITGVPDERWDNDTLIQELSQVHGSDFEAVDVFSLMVDPDSGRVKASE